MANVKRARDWLERENELWDTIENSEVVSEEFFKLDDEENKANKFCEEVEKLGDNIFCYPERGGSAIVVWLDYWEEGWSTRKAIWGEEIDVWYPALELKVFRVSKEDIEKLYEEDEEE